MGNFFSRHKTEHNLNATVQEFELEDVTEKPSYNRLNRTQIDKLNELYGIILDKVAIDHDNPEMKDIRYAVHKLLDRIKERANERGVFSISRVQSCGSMVEGRKDLCLEIRPEYKIIIHRIRFSGNSE